MICVSVQERDFAKCKEILAGCPMAELRGDLCQFTTPQIEELVQGHPNLLYTHRIFNSTLEVAREQVCTAIKKGVKYVDIEIEAPMDYLEYIKSYARVNGCQLIISYHNFEGTQSLQELQTIYDICRRKGADIVKIVTTAHNISDASRVMQLYNYRKADRDLAPDNYMERGEESGSLSNSFGSEQAKLVAFCMGEAGCFTRHLCLHLGAPYTYAALDEATATAPGQYTKAQMEQLLSPANYPFESISRGESIFARRPQITIPCSKSIAQRAILAAAFANGSTTLENFEPCNDSMGALQVIESLGAKAVVNGTTLTIESQGAESLKGIGRISVGESGLLTRLLIPFAMYLSGSKKGGECTEIEITGEGSILKRNLGESVKALEAAGTKCSSKGGFLPFGISCREAAQYIEFSGRESSQIVSGFLMMLPLLDTSTTLVITNPSSTPYIELTLRVLKQFGIKIDSKEELPDKITFNIAGGQKYTPTTFYLDSDWSSAAYFAVAGALTDGVKLLNMPLNSAQADEMVLKLLQMYGYRLQYESCGSLHNITIGGKTDESTVGIKSAGGGYQLSLKDSPDLFPIAAVLAGYGDDETLFEGVERLAQKESNRAETILCELSKAGYNISIEGDKMRVCPGVKKRGTEILVQGHNDHRIAMSLYIAALVGGYKLNLDNIKCIDKSFPSFVERLKK